MHDLLPQPLAAARQLIAAVPELAGHVPAIAARSGEAAFKRFIEFFATTISNPNTRAAYVRAVSSFLSWQEDRRPGETFLDIEPMDVSAYVRHVEASRSVVTAKQHLSAIRRLFDWLVTGHIVIVNPATSVKGPSHSVAKGKTPYLTPDQVKQLIESIALDTITGYRDRALIAVMAYTFARISAALAMDVSDIFQQGRTLWVRLHEKGGKAHQMPCHHRLTEHLDAYLSEARLSPEEPLFQSATRARQPVLTGKRLNRFNALDMVKRRAIAAGLPVDTCNHTFRATGITTFLENGGLREQAQRMAAHSDPKTTAIYDRRSDAVTVSEIERIRYEE